MRNRKKPESKWKVLHNIDCLLFKERDRFVCDISLGDYLRDVRKENGLNQTQLGKILGLSTMAISKWEHK